MELKNTLTKDEIKGIMRDFISSSPLNTMEDGTGEPAWDDALVGFASGADPIWQQLKEYAGAFHWTPWEVFNQHVPGNKVSAGSLTVISWVLPQRKEVRKSNLSSERFPSEEWARIRVYGEAFNTALRRHVVEKLEESGHRAVAPILARNWTIVNSERFSWASTWSERHVAHAAGLGTFGLCEGLITAKGKAMRAGSVVANISLEPDPRSYSNHHAYCLFYAEGTCKKCIDRCPAHAISEKGHDKEKCRLYLAETRKYVKEKYNFEGYGCGLCQVGVPCESMIPVKSAREALERGELPPPPPPIA